MQRAATSILPTAGNMLAQAQQQRGMATLKIISMRLKSVKNIQKITQSMKMVSAAKYTRAERELRQCRPIGNGTKAFFDKAEVAAPAEGEKKKLYICITSDRGKIDNLKRSPSPDISMILGLCGAVHTGVVRHIRGDLTADPSIKVICIGDKSRAVLQRLYSKNILLVANEVSQLLRQRHQPLIA